jgi:hypothetical protein
MGLPWTVSMRENLMAFKHVRNFAREARVCYKDGEFAGDAVCLQAS